MFDGPLQPHQRSSSSPCSIARSRKLAVRVGAPGLPLSWLPTSYAGLQLDCSTKILHEVIYWFEDQQSLNCHNCASTKLMTYYKYYYCYKSGMIHALKVNMSHNAIPPFHCYNEPSMEQQTSLGLPRLRCLIHWHLRCTVKRTGRPIWITHQVVPGRIWKRDYF